VSMAFALPMNTSEVSFFQAENTRLTQAHDVGFAARAPPMAGANVTATGGVTVMRGSVFALHRQETVAALFGFGVDLSATNRTVANADDLAAIRTQRGLTDANTVGAARTDIPGLEGRTFEGISPTVRNDAGLPSLDELYGTNRPIQSPRTNALFTRHAEEDIFNGIARQIDNSGLTAAQLNGRTVNIHISNQSGVCTACYQGLTNPNVPAGVVKQFSDRYPGVTVRITSDGGVARPGVQELVVRGGVVVE
jgi:hypothetical protein